MENEVTTTLITGSSEISESLMFEAAIHWAEEGHRVFYIRPTRLEYLPSKYHDRSKPSTAGFKLIRFMYLSNNEALVEQLIDLHTSVVLPSVLLIEKFDQYTEDPSGKSSDDVLVAKTCAITIDAMNACSRILKKRVQLCASVCSTLVSAVHLTYFGNIWRLTMDDDGMTVTLSKARNSTSDRSFKFRKLDDGTIVLKDILRFVAE